MKTEYEEMEELIDQAADEYKSTDEILAERDLDIKSAIKAADEFRVKYFSYISKLGFEGYNISRLCYELSVLEEINEEILFVYSALLTENGLLYGDISDSEQKIMLWLEQKDKVDIIMRLILREPELNIKLHELSAHKPQNSNAGIDREEQALLFNSVIEYPFLYKAKNSNVFLDNLGELVRQVNSDELYRSVKPYIYFAVLTRKHKLITEREHYSPNLASVFNYQKYKISADNGKNFDNYQAYLELYGSLRCYYADEIDGELTDHCMANLSNLCEWFFDNCEPEAEIPMSLGQVADCLSTTIWLENDIPDISDFIDSNPVIEIAYNNILSDKEFAKNIITAARYNEDVEDFAQFLYDKANASGYCSDRANAVNYAKLCIYDLIEENNRRTLVNSINKYATANGYRK